MNILKIFTLIAIALMFNSQSFAQQADIDKEAPDFTLKDSYGIIHRLSDYKNQIVVLEWINFDCPFVVKHYSSNNMQSLQKKYTDQDVIWLSICSSAPEKQGNFNNEEINKRIKDQKAKMTAYLIDENGYIGRLYGAKTTPHIYIIDKKGILVYAGAIDDTKSTDKNDIPKSKNYISDTLDKMLNNLPITTKTTVPYGCSVKY